MKRQEIVDEIIKYYGNIQKNKPLVHQITNYVSVNNQANITLAVGARPVMAEHPDELEEILAQADSLLLNIGTIDEKREAVLIRAAELAKYYKVPVVLDPVGVGASRMRKKLSFKLLEIGDIDIIKGNAGEILSLCDIYIDKAAISGVDYISNGKYFDSKVISNFIDFSRKFNVILVITGQEDIVIDHSYQIKINNGAPVLGKISGSGCMMGSLIASSLAICRNPMIAAVTGISIMDISGQLAAKKSMGPGSFCMNLFDEVANLSINKLLSYLRLKVSSDQTNMS